MIENIFNNTRGIIITDLIWKACRKLYYWPRKLIANLFFNARGVTNNGERYDPFLTGHADLCHVERYQFAAKQIANEDVVLDIACGTGYGTCILASAGKNAIGVDVSETAISYAQERGYGSNITFQLSDIFNNRTRGDVVVSFETIEHIKRPSIDDVLLKLLSFSNKMIIGSFPYKEKAGSNQYHYLFDLDEGSVESLIEFGEVTIYYQSGSGEIYSERPVDDIQNIVFIFKKNE